MVTTATVESEVTNRQEESMEVINSSSLITLFSVTSSRLQKVKGSSSLRSSFSKMVLSTKVSQNLQIWTICWFILATLVSFGSFLPCFDIKFKNNYLSAILLILAESTQSNHCCWNQEISKSKESTLYLLINNRHTNFLICRLPRRWYETWPRYPDLAWWSQVWRWVEIEQSKWYW